MDLSLFRSLPRDMRWQIMNQIPFRDLISWCPGIRCTLAYFANRLRYLNVPVRYLDRDRTLQPIDSYVAVLGHEKAVDRDPGVLDYIVKDTKILFSGFIENGNNLIPGVEYYIGVAAAGIRAARNRNLDFAMYTLHLYPDNYDMLRILGEMMDQNMMPQDLLSLLPNKGFVRGGKYYPVTPQERMDYLKGTIGDNMIGMSEAYFYGLVDGKHENLVAQAFRQFSKFIENYPDLGEHVGWNGTPSIIELTLAYAKWTKSSIASNSLRGNNLHGVKLLLDMDIDLVKEQLKYLPPLSIEMAELLLAYGIESDPQILLRGAFIAVDYDLLKLSGMPVLTKNDLVQVAGYMLETYYRKHPETTRLPYLFHHAEMMGNCYNMEVILQMGYVPSEPPYMKYSLDRDLAKVLGLNLSRFPLLSELWAAG